MKFLRAPEKSTSLREDLAVFAALLALLALSVAAAYADWGPASTLLGYLIASLKAALVAWFFMQLRHEKGTTYVFALAGVAWLVILFSLTLSDYVSRGWLPYPSRWPVFVHQRMGLMHDYAPDEKQPHRPGGFGPGR